MSGAGPRAMEPDTDDVEAVQAVEETEDALEEPVPFFDCSANGDRGVVVRAGWEVGDGEVHLVQHFAGDILYAEQAFAVALGWYADQVITVVEESA